MEKIEENELKKDDLKRKHGWFDWHLYPEEPIKIESMVEILCFSVIVSICAFLYYRWNIVPHKEIELVVEDFSDSRTVVGEDSVTRLFSCDAKFTMPMTRHQEFVKDSSVVEISFYPFYSNGQHSDLIDYSFVDDSVRNHLRPFLGVFEEKRISENLFKIYNSALFEHSVLACFSLTDVRQNNLEFDSIKKSIDINHEIYCHTYVGYSVSLPFFHTDDIMKRDTDSISISSFEIKNGKEYREIHLFGRNDSLYSPSTRRLERKHYRPWFEWFNLYYWFHGGYDALEIPRWGRLEDISQAYISLKLKSNTIDSMHLCIDFVGATDFSKLVPEPDIIDMSCITYTDPAKIYKIRKQGGLKFHAKFKELQNLQQIRTFSVTAIMSAFVLVFVVFLISAYFKLKRQYLGSNNIVLTTGQKIFKIIFVGVPLYCLFYWTFAYSLPDWMGAIELPLKGKIYLRPLISNGIALPLVILILIISNAKSRRNITKFVRKYFRPFITISACLTFLSLMGYSMYKYYSADIKALLDKGYYSRATQMMYDKIMDADTISKSDYNLLRAILSENPLADSLVLHNIGRFIIEDGKILIKQKDTISLYDIYTKKIKKIIHPNSYQKPEIKGQYIYINDDDYCDVARVSNPDRFIRFKGKFLGTTDSGGGIVTSIVNVDKSDCAILYYSFPGTKAYKKTFMKNIEGYPEAYLHNTLICEKNDTTIFYEIEGNNIKKQLTHNSAFVKCLNTKEKVVMTSNYGWKYFHYIDNKGISNTDTLSIHSISIKYVKDNVWNKVFIKQLREILREFSADAWIYSISISDSRMYIVSPDLENRNRYNVDVYEIGNKLTKVKSISYDKYVICSDDGYIAYYSDDKLYVESIDGISKLKQIGESRDYYNTCNIINDYLYHYDGSLRVVNLESDSILIAKNKYLSDREKRKLANKIKQMLKNKQ